ncbi:MAG TPA: NAD(P)-dependent oxidoreductase [Casimicrobiaceae bacterium]|jgi:3-hydroxyisobutyrate dehydrogenase|nr:NAD(P)-dependent oxidoreductase [Casimicrobiaceae bacterium]
MSPAPATVRIGWIGTGRMGYAMAERLASGGAALTVWNRTRAKAEPLSALGAEIAPALSDLAACDIVFCMVSTWDDVHAVIAGPGGLLSQQSRGPRLVVECSSISLEGSAALRELLRQRGIDMLAAPVSGNAKVINAGRLSFVCSGPRAAFDAALPYLKMIAPAASYVGEAELARIVKICHNVFLGVVTQSLAEITVLAQKAGVSRHAFLDFMNQSVLGSTFTRYKTPAFVNLDFKVTFTPQLLRKDLDLGLDAARRFEVPMPLASLTRDIVQTLLGHGMREQDFAQLLLLQAEASGIKLQPENVAVNDGL